MLLLVLALVLVLLPLLLMLLLLLLLILITVTVGVAVAADFDFNFAVTVGFAVVAISAIHQNNQQFPACAPTALLRKGNDYRNDRTQCNLRREPPNPCNVAPPSHHPCGPNHSTY